MKQNKITKFFNGTNALRLSTFAGGALLLISMAACKGPSQSKIEKKHAKYVSKMPDAKLQQGDHSGNAEKLANLITWEMAADIDSLINGLTTPEQKYNLREMYCNTAVTNAVRDALNKTNFQELYGFDFFAQAKLPEFQGGARFLKYLQSNQEAYDAAATTIKFSELTEGDYDKMSCGSIVFYRGTYVNPNTRKKTRPYSHTQMVGGKGFSDDVKGQENGLNPGGTKFMPSPKGETITINAYSNLFRYGGDNIDVYNRRNDVVLDEVVVVNTKKYLEVLMKQKSK